MIFERNASIFGPVPSTVYFALTDYVLTGFFFAGTGFTSITFLGLATALFVSHCCTIPTTLPVNQYSTSPADW